MKNTPRLLGAYLLLCTVVISLGLAPRTPADASDRKINLSAITSIAEAKAVLLNTTVLTYLDRGHGTQIEYVRSDGSISLWYPGNKDIVRGAMKLKEGREGLQICFLYFGATYNPITRQRGGDWQCTKFSNYALPIIDLQSGDLFGLSERRRQVPHQLQRNIAQPYAPKTYPTQIPYQVNGKTPLENLQAIWATDN